MLWGMEKKAICVGVAVTDESRQRGNLTLKILFSQTMLWFTVEVCLVLKQFFHCFPNEVQTLVQMDSL